jgi:16S rRNA (cytidine1402-2'-O)-methyltransferase
VNATKGPPPMQTTQQKSGGTYLLAGTVVIARPLEPALYLVSTPIGNLGDVTLRALETLAAADIIACEDTRTSRVLLDRYCIRTKTVSYHDHNQAVAGARLIETLQSEKSVALITDAGTPLVSDPGERLVAEARGAGIRVVPIPGASAVLAALAAAGLPASRFFFEGFLPAKTGQRRARLASLGSLDATLIFYEGPHRLSETLADMSEVFGPARVASVCRELTKTFEEVIVLPLGELTARYPEDASVKGEIVILVEPPKEAGTSEADVDALLQALSKEMSASKAAAEASRLTGIAKADLYQRLLDAKKNGA